MPKSLSRIASLGLVAAGLVGAASAQSALTANSFTSAKANLSWTDESTGEDSFTIERRVTGSGDTWTVAGTSPANTPFFEDTGLSSGTSYDYRVAASTASVLGEWGNVASITPGGQSATSYADWITTYYPNQAVEEDPVYLIDFNTNANPDYGTVKWNTVTSTAVGTPIALSDTTNQPSGISVAITDSFDQFRTDNVAPLAGYAAAAQNSQFCLRDDVPLSGAITFSGLDPSASYDFSFFARRGSLVAGFDYTGTYTFTGSGDPVVVVMDAATSANMTDVPPVKPSASGVVTLTITAGTGTGTHFPVINFIKLKRSKPGVFLVDFNTNANPNYYGFRWNTVNSLAAGSPQALKDRYNNESAYTVAITDGFDQFRTDNVAPLADYPAAPQNSQFALRDDVPLTGAITFGGLDPAKSYDFSFFARRGSLVAGYHYNGTYTFTGSGDPVVVTVDAATSAVMTQVPPVKPSENGTVTVSLSAAAGTGTPFVVINFIRFAAVEEAVSNAELVARDADPDGDGVSNFEEYARGLNPTTADAQPFQVDGFARTAAGTGSRLEFTRDLRASDAEYVIQSSADLSEWITDSAAVRSVISRSGYLETLRFESADGEGDTKRFFRLQLKDLTEVP